jgi:WhiB family redox-sensing transcriptional regulator
LLRRAYRPTSLDSEPPPGGGPTAEESDMKEPERQQQRLAVDPASSWMLEARCRDLSPTIFFPSDGSGVEVARRYCAQCPVTAQCLEFALENHIDHGVWGGASERERRRIARSRRAQSMTEHAAQRRRIAS